MAVPINVLIVEDSDDDAWLVVQQLKQGGYAPAWEQVDDAEAMRAALDRQAWDLIISDFSMPRFGGMAALAIVKERDLDVPFIIVSGAIGEDIAVDAMRAGVQDYILKSNPKRLLPAIAREMEEAAGRRRRAAVEVALQESEEARTRLITELREAVLIRDDFLSVASHELRTPVASLILLVDSLRRRHDRDPHNALSPETMHTKHLVMARQLQRLVRLINEMLDISRLTNGPPPPELEEMDFVAHVYEVVSWFADDLADARCRVEIKADGSLFGRWDRMCLEHVLTQLITNAIKYGRGHPITITIRGDEGQVQCTVRDQGIGIAQGDHARIFERYTRAVSTRNYGGLGLGLWIARQMLATVHGTITVTSRPGKGAAFTVCLPRNCLAEVPEPGSSLPVAGP